MVDFRDSIFQSWFFHNCYLRPNKPEAQISEHSRLIIFYLQVVPWGLRKFLKWMKNTYADTEIMVTENGMSDHNDTLTDDHRIHYLRVCEFRK